MLNSCQYGFYTCEFTGQVDFCQECDEGNNYQMKEETRGGAGRGQGRRLKYGEPVKRVMFKIPISKEKEIKEKIKGILKGYITKGK